jgi:hypothetical protein
MAPYTMTITIQNDSDTRLDWIGSSTYSPLNGTTHVEATECINPGESGRVFISKAGGTDGLFTIASYDFPFRCTSLNIYAMMPASAGSDATVKLVDHSGGNQPQLTSNDTDGAATTWYRDLYNEMTDGPWASNAVEMKWDYMGKQWKYQPGGGDQQVWRITVRDMRLEHTCIFPVCCLH